MNISISEQESDKAVITISDDGKGFDINAPRRNDSYGLIGMKERAYLLDAEFNIDSEPNKGTHVSIVIPYPLD